MTMHTRRPLLVLLLSGVIISLLTPGMGYAQTPVNTPTPTLSPSVSVENPQTLSVETRINPDPLVSGQTVTTLIDLEGQNDSACLGFPNKPLDLFLVFDHSTSAGAGPGSNLEQTKRLLDELLTQANQAIYSRQNVQAPPLRSRIGLIQTIAVTNGAEASAQPLSEDNTQVRNTITSLASTGDTEIGAGIELAIQELEENARPEAAPVILLVLHDHVAINEISIEAANAARNAGIEVYLLANSLNLDPNQQISAEKAAEIVLPNHFFSDPTETDLRYLFVAMSKGEFDLAAAGIHLSSGWTPPSIEVTKVTAGKLDTNTGQATWTLDALRQEETMTLAYEASVPSSLSSEPNVFVELSYLDCNGLPQTVETGSIYQTAESLPTATIELVQPEDPPPSTSLPTAEGSDPTSPLPTVTPVPTDEIQPTATPVLNPIPTVEIPPLELPFQPPDFDLWPFLQPVVDSIGGILMGLMPTLSLTWLGPVLQGLLIFLGILLLLLLLWLLWRWLMKFFRRPSPPTQPVIITPPPPPPPSDPTPAWLKRLTQARALLQHIAEPEKAKFVDTVLLGIGPAGRETLNQVASALNNRFGEEWPANIRLLQIDVQPEGKSNTLLRPKYIRPEQWVLLRPNFDEARRTIQANPKNWPHWLWYEKTSPGYERARGRLALFYDLKDGTSNSRLWNALERALRGLEAPVLRVVGTTFDDASSGMLVDIVSAARLASNSPNMDVELWLAGPMEQDWGESLDTRGRPTRVNDQRGRTLATLRELARFQRISDYDFQFVPPTHSQSQLRRSYNGSVVQTLFLFPATGKNAAEDNVLAIMADALLAVMPLETQQALSQFLKQNIVKIAEKINRDGIGVTAMMGCYAFRLPGTLMTEAIAWRMVEECLFEDELGLVPLFHLDLEKGTTFLLENTAIDAAPIAPALKSHVEALVGRFLNHWNTPGFFATVALEVDQLLNGERPGEEPTLFRKAGLAQADALLVYLGRLLKQNDAREASHIISKLREELKVWHTWMSETVAPKAREARRNAQNALKNLHQQPTRSWAIDASLESQTYQKNVRPSALSKGNSNDQPLLRLAQRFGWWTRYDQDAGWRVQFLAPPGDFVWSEGVGEPVDLTAFPLDRADAQKFLDALYRLALPLAHNLNRETALAIAQRANLSQLMEKADPNPQGQYFNASAASLIGEVNRQTFFVTAPDAGVTTLTTQLTVSDAKERVVPCETSDTTSVTLLRVSAWIPLQAAKMYEDEVWTTNPVPSTLYVWPAEQTAAEIEADQPRFSARFVQWLGNDPELMDVLARAYIYDLPQKGWDGWELPGLPAIPSQSWCEVLATLLERDKQPKELKSHRTKVIDTLRDAIQQKRVATPERMKYLLAVEKERLAPLSASVQVCERDFAQYARHILKAERQEPNNSYGK